MKLFRKKSADKPATEPDGKLQRAAKLVDDINRALRISNGLRNPTHPRAVNLSDDFFRKLLAVSLIADKRPREQINEGEAWVMAAYVGVKLSEIAEQHPDWTDALWLWLVQDRAERLDCIDEFNRLLAERGG